MKSKIKDNATWREYHELEKASRNHEHDNNDYSNDTFNKHTESISDCDIIKKSDKREKK